MSTAETFHFKAGDERHRKLQKRPRFGLTSLFLLSPTRPLQPLTTSSQSSETASNQQMSPTALPTELILKILNTNLNPRDGRTRMNSLALYMQLNKSLNAFYKPQLVVHIHLDGSYERIWKLLPQIRRLVLEERPELQNEVKTIVCDLPHIPPHLIDQATRIVVEIVVCCPQIEEMAFRNLYMLDLDRISRVPGSALRVLHLSRCSIMNAAQLGNFATLRYLTLDHFGTPAQHGAHLPPSLISYSSSSGSVAICPHVTFPAFKLLRATHEALLRRTDWPTSIESLEIIDNKSLEDIEFLICRVTRLHASVSPSDLLFLVKLLLLGDLPLKVLRLARIQDDPRTDQFWFVCKETLEIHCKIRQIQLDVDFQEKEGAARFWEQCTMEEFILEGFL